MDTRRQILFLIPTLTAGGAERVITTLLHHLDKKKFRLILAVADMYDSVYREDVPKEVEFVDLQCSRVRYALPKIIQLIRRRRPEVVISTMGHLNLALSILRPLLPDEVRYIARETSIVSELIRHYRKPWFWAWAYRRFYSRFDAVVCQSNYMSIDLIENFGLPKSKAVVIHNPVDIKRIHYLMTEAVNTELEPLAAHMSETPIQLVAAGRLSHEKGFDLLIEALALCNNPRMYLTILGKGPLRGELEQLAIDRGISQQVRFAGFQKNPYPFFANAHVFILSSRFEGFPNVVLEALACGTPVIATPAPGGVKEIMEGKPGCLLAESVTAEGLAAAIQRFSGGKIIATDIIRPYAVETVTRCYEQVFS